MYSPLGTQEECPCHYLFTEVLMPLSTNLMQEADGYWLSPGIFFFYRFSFFILSGLQYTKSGFHEVGMERGLGHQTLPAQKCHQNISDMINVDILIYFFFSWSKTKLIITQSILRLKISCAQKVTSSKSLSRIISTSILKTYELIYKLTLTNRQTNRETHGQIYSFS